MCENVLLQKRPGIVFSVAPSRRTLLGRFVFGFQISGRKFYFPKERPGFHTPKTRKRHAERRHWNIPVTKKGNFNQRRITALQITNIARFKGSIAFESAYVSAGAIIPH